MNYSCRDKDGDGEGEEEGIEARMHAATAVCLACLHSNGMVGNGRSVRRALGPQKERGRGSCIRTVCRGISKPLRVGLCAMEVNLRFCPTTCEEEKFFSLVIALFCTPPSARPGPSSSLIHLRTTSRGGGRVAAASQRSRRIWLSWSPRAFMTSTTATDCICEQ